MSDYDGLVESVQVEELKEFAGRVPPAGLWDEKARAEFGDLREIKVLDTKPYVLTSVDSGPGVEMGSGCEMSGEEEAGLCLTIMVMEELQGLFAIPFDVVWERSKGGATLMQLSWEAWVHGMLAARV